MKSSNTEHGKNWKLNKISLRTLNNHREVKRAWKMRRNRRPELGLDPVLKIIIKLIDH